MPGGRIQTRLKGLQSFADCMAFSPDGRWLVAGGGNERRGSEDAHTVQTWDTRTGGVLSGFAADSGVVTPNAVAVSPDGRLVATSTPYVVRLRRVAEGRLDPEGTILVGEDTFDFAFSQDGALLVGGSFGKVHLWEIPSGRYTQMESEEMVRHHTVRFSPEGGVLLAAYRAFIRRSTTP